ncbi:MAG: hypothetical protein EPN79_02130 [Burkholderiaceae bacterium]|nr:MAG: hypothetical protein EPN79_02130 [Burkholderiaceae bacterium]TBR76165.1 MAG: hypothetical protein EPN64_09145 [Burkholderiaceae bacterium]
MMAAIQRHLDAPKAEEIMAALKQQDRVIEQPQSANAPIQETVRETVIGVDMAVRPVDFGGARFPS